VIACSLLFPIIVWIVTAAGQALAARIGLPPSATRLERTIIGFALGLGVLAYGMLLLGLLGLLYPVAGLLWVLVLAAVGGRQHLVLARDLREGRPPPMTWQHGLWSAAFLAFGLASLIGVFAPPVVFLPGVNATEWDSLSYHLADPKIFLQLHRIVSLPWQPHSNFAFTTEMWYTLALMAHGSVPLAKCFSWACAAGTVLIVYALGARHLSPRIGAWAALLFAATPLAFWEAGTAYIDGATAFFATLALLCVVTGMREGDNAWLRLGAVLMGFALSTKATALAFALLLTLGVLLWAWQRSRTAFPALRQAAGWGVVTMLVGSPWYIKSWICTGNPIYPYFYGIFGGRWWSKPMAAAYAGANSPGLGHSLSAALLIPWNVTMAIMPGHLVGAGQPFNEFPTVSQALTPLFLAALFVPTWRRAKTPGVVKALTAYAAAATLLWFTQTQFIRFLLPLVPVYCLLTAWAIFQPVPGRSWATHALKALLAFSFMWSLTVAYQLARPQIAVALGQQSRPAFQAQNDAGYGAIQYLNHNLPTNAKIAFFGHPLGFYCDRPYLWADQSAYVFTPSVTSPATLLQRLHALGVTDILVDQRSATFAPGNSPFGWLYALTAAQERPLYPGPGDRDTGVLVYALPSSA
jgi:hypothetical protein